MTWTYHLGNLDESSFKVTIRHDSYMLNFADVIDGWQSDVDFREFYISLLTEIPFEAAFWEMLPITKETISNKYEFVVAQSQALSSVESDPRSFGQNFQLAGKEEAIVAFENLGRDAMLVVPCPAGQQDAYAHLTKFLREGPHPQKHELFQRLGKEVEHRLSSEPLWISTSGLGVHWLHVRLDARPKYYTHGPYRRFL